MSFALDDLRDLYQELILDHGKHPRNRHACPACNREALGHNPMCGDKFTIRLHVSDENIIQDATFEGQGCAISVASASMMTEMLKGKTAADAQVIFDYFHTLCTTGDVTAPASISADDLDRLTALSGVRQFPVRVKCATLAWHTMQAALCPAAFNESRVTTESSQQGGGA
jgi:nitrogen fixation NifU-like protein